MARRCQIALLLPPMLLVAGCATAPGWQWLTAKSASTQTETVDPFLTRPAPADAGPPIQLTAHESPAEVVPVQALAPALRALPSVAAMAPEAMPTPLDGELAPGGVLDADRLVAEVLRRNPSVEAMVAAWEAAAARYPQAVALDDPMVEYATGPDSWGDPDVHTAYMVAGSQRIPWPGKRRLRGRIVNWEAASAASDIDNVRLELAAAARIALVDYYAAHRELALNAANVRELRDFRETATAKLRAATASQQDVLQADVELALLQRRQNELERAVRVATARINTLLHRDADHPLAPPPAELVSEVVVPSAAELRETASQRRPDLAALSAEIEAARAEVTLACREFYPDFELYYQHNAFMPDEDLRDMLGLRANVPIYRDKRWAAVREARAKLESRRAQHRRLVDEVADEIAALHARLEESQRNALLYRQQIIPAAQQNVDLARAGYTAGGVDFLRLIDAERQLIMLREQEVDTLADLHRALAELERAAGSEIDE